MHPIHGILRALSSGMGRWLGVQQSPQTRGVLPAHPSPVCHSTEGHVGLGQGTVSCTGRGDPPPPGCAAGTGGGRVMLRAVPVSAQKFRATCQEVGEA